MTILFEGVKENEGFFLLKAISWKEDMMVLIGRNGCGKTRYLEGIVKENIRCILDGKTLNGKEISLIHNASLHPNNDIFDITQHEVKVRNTLGRYGPLKNTLDKPFVHNVNINLNAQNNVLPDDKLHILFNRIAEKLNKKPSELTHDEIEFNYEEPVDSLFGYQKISALVNTYIQKTHKNKYNEWLYKQEKQNVQFFEESEFEEKYGKKPWLVINKILKDTFNGKFQLSVPDEKSHTYDYKAQVIDQENGKTVQRQYLSSGEQTLYWLAMSLFNTIYFENKVINFPKLLMLDEPDVALHPSMVLNLLNVLNSFSKTYGTKIIFSTHSPTTVALAPENSIAILDESEIRRCDKDTGITELLHGVSHISIYPENRKQVYVESLYDAQIYEQLYSKLRKSSEYFVSNIHLNFISAGPKMPEKQISDKLKQICKIDNQTIIDDFIQQINGVGNCDQVYGAVDALLKKGDKQSYGIVDWDKKNKSNGRVQVLAEGIAYAIENVILDPIAILLLLQIEKPDKYTPSFICGKEVELFDLIKDEQLLQCAVDKFIGLVLDRANKKNCTIKYVSGVSVLSDEEYLTEQGHGSEKNLANKFPELQRFYQQGKKDGTLKLAVAQKSMIYLTGGKLIPKVIEDVLLKLQQLQ